jgi:hypothetical protein
MTYTPNGNYHGEDSFKFKVNNGNFDSNIVTISLLIVSVNDSPITKDDRSKTDEDTEINIDVLVNDSDLDGRLDNNTLSIVSHPIEGKVRIINGKITYTPNSNYDGNDSFTYSVEDDEGLVSNVAKVSLSIKNINDIPYAEEQNVSLKENNSKEIILGSFDNDNNAITYHILSLPLHGDLTGNLPNIVYTPHHNYVGNDRFLFKVNNGLDDSTSALVSIVVNSNNIAPMAYSQSTVSQKSVAKDILLHGYDNDGDSLNYSIVTQPQYGKLSGNPPHVIYTSDNNHTGKDCFRFRVNDGNLDSKEAIVFVSTRIADVNNTRETNSLMTIEELSLAINVNKKSYNQTILGEKPFSELSLFDIRSDINIQLDSSGYGSIYITLNNNQLDDISIIKVFFFMDISIEEERNTFFNEYGEYISIVGLGSEDLNADYWQIDEPDYLNGHIIDNIRKGILDNTNHTYLSEPNDVSMALGFDINTLKSGEAITFQLRLSPENIGGLSQIDAQTGAKVYFNTTMENPLLINCNN